MLFPAINYRVGLSMLHCFKRLIRFDGAAVLQRDFVDGLCVFEERLKTLTCSSGQLNTWWVISSVVGSACCIWCQNGSFNLSFHIQLLLSNYALCTHLLRMCLLRVEYQFLSTVDYLKMHDIKMHKSNFACGLGWNQVGEQVNRPEMHIA